MVGADIPDAWGLRLATPPVRSAYQTALLDARRSGFALSREAQLRLLAAFRDAAREIEFDLTRATDPLTEARARLLRAQILEVIDRLEVRIATTASRSVTTTIDDVLDIHREVINDLFHAAGLPLPPGLSPGLAHLNVRAAAVIAARRESAALMRTLVHRHVTEVAPALDALLTGAISRGVSVRRLTADIADLLATAEGADLSRYGVGDSRVSGLRTLFFDSRRIAVSETMNALREANAQALTASPIVLAVKWQRSGRHDGLRSSPDECDILAEDDFYGFGPGYYPPEKWPLAPHSFCACIQGGPTQFRPPAEWATPKPPPPPLQVGLQDLDVTRAVAGTGNWSEARVASATRAIRAALADPIGQRSRRRAA